MNPLIGALIGPITDLLKRLIPDVNARAQATEEITKLLIAQESSVLDAMKSVMTADAQSEGWLTRNARPIVVMWCLFAMTAIMGEAVLFGTTSIVNALKQVPDTLLNLLSIGIGGYILARGAQLTAREIAQGRQNSPSAPSR